MNINKKTENGCDFRMSMFCEKDFEIDFFLKKPLIFREDGLR